MKVTVTPTQNFHHDRWEGRKGEPLEGVSLVQARELKRAGLIEDFDEGTAEEAGDADKGGASVTFNRVDQGAKRAPEPENKAQPEPANKAVTEPAAKAPAKK